MLCDLIAVTPEAHGMSDPAAVLGSCNSLCVVVLGLQGAQTWGFTGAAALGLDAALNSGLSVLLAQRLQKTDRQGRKTAIVTCLGGRDDNKPPLQNVTQTGAIVVIKVSEAGLLGQWYTEAQITARCHHEMGFFSHPVSTMCGKLIVVTGGV